MFVTLDTVHNKGIKVKLYSHCFVIVNFFGIDKVPIFFSKVQNRLKVYITFLFNQFILLF